MTLSCYLLAAVLTVPGIRERGPAPVRTPGESCDDRPPATWVYHNLSEIWAAIDNTGEYCNGAEWPGGLGSYYLWYGSVWASAYGEVTPSAEVGSYVSCYHWVTPMSEEFYPSEGYPMRKTVPGPVALEETTWAHDDWYAAVNENPMGLQIYATVYSWDTPGYNQFLVNDLVVTHHSQHGNPGVPLDAFCLSVFGDCDISSADPADDFFMDDLVFYDGHAIWCNDPEATFDYRFDTGDKASEADIYVYQQNPQGSCTDPLDNVFYFYSYRGSDGLIDADADYDGVSDHFTILFRVAGGDTIYPVEPNTGLELFSDGRPLDFWEHTVGDTTFAVVPRNTSYMWDGDDPETSEDDTGQLIIVPPCNGFIGWRLLDLWIRRADGTIERPVDVYGCPIPLSHSWWNWANSPTFDALRYQYQWGDNQEGSGRLSGPAYLADWMGDPCAPEAFAPMNPGPFPVVQDNPLSMDFPPFDYGFLLTVGPVDLADGDSLHITGGWIIGRGLEDMRIQSDNLLDAYYRDGGWGVPDVPPVPTFFYEAGDGVIDLVWSDDAEVYQPFGGYRLYRSLFDICDWELVGEFGDETHSFTDSDVTRGFPYYYVLCSYDAETLIESQRTNYKQELDGTPIPVVPGWDSEEDWTGMVNVVPNPYRGSANWEVSHLDRIAFINLPAVCDIHVYTLAGEHVITLEHRDYGGDSGEEYWDLRNSSGRGVASGLYVYCVQTTDDHVVGKFAVIR